MPTPPPERPKKAPKFIPFVTEALIQSIPQNNFIGLEYICKQWGYYYTRHGLGELKNKATSLRRDYETATFEAWVFLNAFIVENSLGNELQFAPLDPAEDDWFISALQAFKHSSVVAKREADKLHTSIMFNKAEEKVLRLMDKQFVYKFSESDVERVNELVKALRETIVASEEITGDYEKRILKKLDNLEAEIALKMTTLDVFYVLLGDAGVLHHKLKENAIPVVSLIKKITSFAWRSTVQAEGLPSDSALEDSLNIKIEDPKS